jgi:hypothetical protein
VLNRGEVAMIPTSLCVSKPRITGLCVAPSVTETLQTPVQDRSHPKVTPSSAKVTFTTAAGTKIAWQAGMSKGMSDVRSYVALRAEYSAECDRRPNKEVGKSEKHAWYPGMYKGMKSLAGYVARGGRENRDF